MGGDASPGHGRQAGVGGGRGESLSSGCLQECPSLSSKPSPMVFHEALGLQPHLGIQQQHKSLGNG